MRCPTCGRELKLKPGAKFCGGCGAEIMEYRVGYDGINKQGTPLRIPEKERITKLIILALFVLLIIAIGVIFFILTNPQSKIQNNNETSIKVKQQNSNSSEEEAIYQQAKNLYDNGLLLEAKQCYMKIYNYKDSYSQIRRIQQVYENKLSAACWQTVALRKDDAVLITYSTDDSKYDINWNNLDAISAGWGHIVGLNANGNVVAVEKGNSVYHETDVAEWSNIVTVTAGRAHTVGLRSDGTAVAVGNNDLGQCDLDKWNNLVAICSNGYDYTVGLRSDGTVLNTFANVYKQLDTSSWSDIVAIAAGGTHIVGLQSNGRVVAVGVKPIKVENENSIIVNMEPMNREGACDTDSWTNIVAIAAGINFTLGLKADGTVIATGDNTYGQCNVNEWKDIVAIAAGYQHSVGLKKDGTLVAVGDNDNRQCDVYSWQLWN